MRQEIYGVDMVNFREWAKKFVESTSDLTANERKVLLLLGGYHTYMSLDVLELLCRHGVIAYAIPAHTSGRTQPCDLVPLGYFTKQRNKIITSLLPADEATKITMYEYCTLVRNSYYYSHKRSIIQALFRRKGLWPLYEGRLFVAQLPKSSDDLDAVMCTDALILLLNEKKERRS